MDILVEKLLESVGEKTFNEMSVFIGNLTQGLSSSYQKKCYEVTIGELPIFNEISELKEKNPKVADKYQEIVDALLPLVDQKYSDVNQAIQTLQARISKNVNEMIKDKTVNELASK